MSVGPCEESGGARGEATIDFQLSSDQEAVRRAIERICERFPDDYWLTRDRDGGFPHEFHAMLAADGWLGIAMPEAYGGGGLGITEAAIMMQAIAESGAGMAGGRVLLSLNPMRDSRRHGSRRARSAAATAP